MYDNHVCIVGCGNVGMASAFALIQSDLIRELVLVGHSEDKTEGEVMDLRHAVAVPMKAPVRITNGSYADAARCPIVVVTAGAASADPDVSRLDLLEQNVGIIREIVGSLKAEGFDGVLIMATNPVDVLSQVAQEASGLPASRVIGTGTLIDTARLRSLLAEELDVEPRAVDAYIIGEHGESEIAVWSGARVAGLPLASYPGADDLAPHAELLDQIRDAGPEVAQRKGNTAYAIALCIVRICEAVLRDERAVLAVSARMQGQYDLKDVYLGTPCIVGRNGIERAIALDLDPDEQAGLEASAKTLKESLATLR
jgi:L-lactate dehydrogenase